MKWGKGDLLLGSLVWVSEEDWGICGGRAGVLGVVKVGGWDDGGGS